MRVLLVDASDRGGIARYTRCLRTVLEGAGVEVALAAPAGAGDAGLLLATPHWGPDVDRLHKAQLYTLRLRELAPSARAVVRAVARANPSVIHAQTAVVPGIDALVLRRLARRAPVVLTVHDALPLDGGVRALADEARRWRAADALIVHAEEARFVVEESAPGVPVHVVPVDADFFRPVGAPPASRPEARRALGLTEGPTALLMGQIRRYKGVDLLAQAWPQVVAALPGARLCVVGEAYDGAELLALERAPGVEVRRGFVAEDDLDRWTAAADVLVLPYAAGSHSGVLHRGLAVGTPVMASPPLSEEVYRTRAGTVVPLDPAAWTEALVRALGSHPLPPPAPPPGGETVRRTLAVYDQVLSTRVRGAK